MELDDAFNDDLVGGNDEFDVFDLVDETGFIKSSTGLARDVSGVFCGPKNGVKGGGKSINGERGFDLYAFHASRAL